MFRTCYGGDIARVRPSKEASKFLLFLETASTLAHE